MNYHSHSKWRSNDQWRSRTMDIFEEKFLFLEIFFGKIASYSQSCVTKELNPRDFTKSIYERNIDKIAKTNIFTASSNLHKSRARCTTVFSWKTNLCKPQQFSPFIILALFLSASWLLYLTGELYDLSIWMARGFHLHFHLRSLGYSSASRFKRAVLNNDSADCASIGL